MSDARKAILSNIRHALGAERLPLAEDYASITREYRYGSAMAPDELVELFASRIVHYDGGVTRCTEDQLSDTIGKTLVARGKRRLYVPDLEVSWFPEGFSSLGGDGASIDELDRSEGVVTGCTVGIALTGTIVLTHNRSEGPRALTLLPDYHLVIVFGDQIVETVPEAMRRLSSVKPALITTISGPSATADIEMTRVRGVHGPRVLDVILVGGCGGDGGTVSFTGKAPEGAEGTVSHGGTETRRTHGGQFFSSRFPSRTKNLHTILTIRRNSTAFSNGTNVAAFAP